MSATTFFCVFLAAFIPNHTFASETTLAINTLQCVDGQECSQSPAFVQKQQVYVAKASGLDQEKEEKETIENNATEKATDDASKIITVGQTASSWDWLHDATNSAFGAVNGKVLGVGSAAAGAGRSAVNSAVDAGRSAVDATVDAANTRVDGVVDDLRVDATVEAANVIVGDQTCILTANAAISGHNVQRLTSQTVSSCQAACHNANWCKSFDWSKRSASCDLSDKCASDVGGLKTNYAGNPYDHYSCYCQTCILTANAAISGHNVQRLTSQTVSSCQAACHNANWCKSFDWSKRSASCDLSDKCASDVGGLKTNYAGNPYDHYSCDC